ncbi:hypothetical protein CPB86DRAFT_185544 [Serendipita vermifera]|nr:hypothetical protein CPB86DRAFT_185544 [Serendipita vermifera]
MMGRLDHAKLSITQWNEQELKVDEAGNEKDREEVAQEIHDTPPPLAPTILSPFMAEIKSEVTNIVTEIVNGEKSRLEAVFQEERQKAQEEVRSLLKKEREEQRRLNAKKYAAVPSKTVWCGGWGAKIESSVVQRMAEQVNPKTPEPRSAVDEQVPPSFPVEPPVISNVLEYTVCFSQNFFIRSHDMQRMHLLVKGKQSKHHQ